MKSNLNCEIHIEQTEEPIEIIKEKMILLPNSKFINNSLWMIYGMTNVYNKSINANKHYDFFIRARYDIEFIGQLIEPHNNLVLYHDWANKKVYFDGFFILQNKNAKSFYKNFLDNYILIAEKSRYVCPEFIISFLLYKSGLNTKLSIKNKQFKVSILRNFELSQIFSTHIDRNIKRLIGSNIDMIARLDKPKLYILMPTKINKYLFGNVLKRVFYFCIYIIRKNNVIYSIYKSIR